MEQNTPSLTYPKHLKVAADHASFIDAMAQHCPDMVTGLGKIALDVGCGSSTTPGDTRHPLELRGYAWVGIDMAIGRVSV
jgi:hypothetical protein